MDIIWRFKLLGLDRNPCLSSPNITYVYTVNGVCGGHPSMLRRTHLSELGKPNRLGNSSIIIRK
jgi:hypothetical protein